MSASGTASPSRPDRPAAPVPWLRSLLMCMTCPAQAGRLGGWLRRWGAVGVAVAPERLGPGLAARMAQGHDAAVIDLDALGDPDLTMDLCLILRQAAPALPIVVLTSETGPTDPLALRLGLCHAELPRDFGAAAAAMALDQAARRAVAMRRRG